MAKEHTSNHLQVSEQPLERHCGSHYVKHQVKLARCSLRSERKHEALTSGFKFCKKHGLRLELKPPPHSIQEQLQAYLHYLLLNLL